MKTLSMPLLLLIVLFLTEVRSSVTPTAMECYYNKDVCNPSSCDLSQGRGKFKYLSAYCNFIKPITSALVKVEVLRKTRGGDYKATDIKIATDICDIGNIKGRNGIINNVISMSMKSLGKLKCPLKGNITISRMPLLVVVMQGLLTEADYKIVINVTNDIETLLKMNISLSVTTAKR